MEFQRTRNRNRAVNMTPLIDVVFLLIIFFMLTSSFSHNESIDLSFPLVPDAAASDAPPVILLVADKGRLFLQNEQIEQDTMQAQLQDTFSADPGRRVVIMSTNDVSVQEIVSVMDDVHVAGGQHVSLSDWKY